MNPTDKCLAIQVEDHALEYGNFEGVIPEGEYGAGEVTIWDKGAYAPIGDMEAGLEKGHITFVLHGSRLKGEFTHYWGSTYSVLLPALPHRMVWVPPR